MKLFFTLTLAAAIATNANATVHIVTCQNSPSHFLPVTVNAVVGDTIEWDWVAGTHVVGPINSSYIPAGAAMFNHLIDNNNLGFAYVVTVAGNYHYVCHPATPHGEDGYINVTSATAVPSINMNYVSLLFPNPFADKFTVQTPVGDKISLRNLLGEEIRSVSFRSGQTAIQVEATDLTPGIYFCSIMKEGVIVETRKLVKE